MNFSNRARATFAVLWLALAAGSHAQVQPAPEYVRLDPPRPVASGDKIEVIEFFYYGCPICYELEPKLSRWSASAPADIALSRVPALATASWENFARLHYA